MTGDKRVHKLPPMYCSMFGVIAEIANKHGYAAAVHGSLARDLDVVAVPWTEEAGDARTLVEAIKAGGSWLMDLDDMRPDLPPQPALKPHGRMVWTLVLDGGGFVDLSVMPTTPASEAEAFIAAHRADIKRVAQNTPDWIASPANEVKP